MADDRAVGSSGGSTRFASVTTVQWLPPTRDNQAKALVTIPPGYHRVRFGSQPVAAS